MFVFMKKHCCKPTGETWVVSIKHH